MFRRKGYLKYGLLTAKYVNGALWLHITPILLRPDKKLSICTIYSTSFYLLLLSDRNCFYSNVLVETCLFKSYSNDSDSACYQFEPSKIHSLDSISTELQSDKNVQVAEIVPHTLGVF